MYKNKYIHHLIQKLSNLYTKNKKSKNISSIQTFLEALFKTDLFAKGINAELTIIDPTEEWIFSKTDIYSRSVNSPYIGRSLNGRVKYAIVKGYITNFS